LVGRIVLGYDPAVTPEDLRRLVPAAHRSAYLNTATYGPAAEPTAAAVRDFTDSWSNGSGRFEDWQEQAEECRALFAGLLDCPVEDVALQPYVSGAAGMVAAGLRPGDRVVVNEIEFASNLWPWLVQRERGVEVSLVPVRGGRCEIADYEAAIGGRVTLVAVSAFQSSNGWRAPLRALADLAHRAGGMLFVDACQGAGGIRLDPATDGFDLLAADSYKWLMGPRGSGYMYLSPGARDRLRPNAVGGFNARSRTSSFYGPAMELSESASRFDSSLSWIAAAGDREALNLLARVGIDAIEAHNLALAERFRAGVEELGIATDAFPEAERSPIVALNLDDADAAAARLAEAGVVVARRAGAVRFSFHVFNNRSDVDRALEALA
jgi:cysteine desulfurase / selenocysteine lyase